MFFDAQILSSFADGAVQLLLSTALRGVGLLAVALGLSLLLRRAPAAARHLVWTLTVVGLLSLPLLSVVVPAWQVDALPSLAASTPTRTETPARTLEWAQEKPTRTELVRVNPMQNDFFATPLPVETPQPGLRDRAVDYAASLSTGVWVLLAWELGALLVALWVLTGFWHLRSLSRSSRPLVDTQWTALADEVSREIGLTKTPRLLRTKRSLTPMTWGLRRPVVLLPESADTWSNERKRDVLRHEFAHVARRDVLTQCLAQIACALFWFHPLPWIAAGRMRLERERACDDRVLLAGSRASAYAGHLLEMARSLQSESSLAAATLAMARRSQLGERVDALLDESPRSRRFHRWARLGLTLALAAVLIPLAALQPGQAAPPERDRPQPRFPAPPALPAVVAAPSGIGQNAPAAPFAVASGRHPRGAELVAEFDDVVLHEGMRWTNLEADGRELDSKGASFELRDGDHRLSVELDGRVRFGEDDRSIEWMEEDAWFELEEREGRDRRRVELRGGEEGFEEEYFEDGKRADFDDAARTWFADALEEFMTHSGIGVPDRVARWVENDGVEATADRIAKLDGEWILATHANALLDNEDLDDEQRASVLERLSPHIDSDFAKVRLFTEHSGALLHDADLGHRALVLLDEIDSDFEKRRALSLVLETEGLDEALLSDVLVLVDEMDSDFERGQLLLHLAPRVHDSGSRTRFWQAVEGLDSDFERQRVVNAFLDEVGDDEESLLQALKAVEAMDGDFQKVQILTRMADRCARYETTREAYLTVAEELDSDFQYGQAMRALRRAEK